MKNVFYVIFSLFFCFVINYSCKKDKGKNPELAYSDKALLDSCLNEAAFVYYKNDAGAVLSGIHGPHGSFKLKFNKIATAVLTDAGKIPAGYVFPEGSMVVKQIMNGNTIVFYAFMYKYNGSWLWGEAKPNRDLVHGVNDNASICTSCHQQTGNRDWVTSFHFY